MNNNSVLYFNDFIYLLNAKLYKQTVFDFELIYRYIKVKIDLVDFLSIITCNICKEIIIIIIMFDYYISLFYFKKQIWVLYKEKKERSLYISVMKFNSVYLFTKNYQTSYLIV